MMISIMCGFELAPVFDGEKKPAISEHIPQNVRGKMTYHKCLKFPAQCAGVHSKNVRTVGLDLCAVSPYLTKQVLFFSFSG